MEVHYGPADKQTLLLVHPPLPHSRPSLVVFVHGGAWRAGDSSQHTALADALVSLTGCAVAVPNYRLTPTYPPSADVDGPEYISHPTHAEDVRQALVFLNDWTDAPFDSQHIYLIGHSCGAHILSSIFLDSRPVSPSLAPPSSLLEHVRSIVLVEGIYDIDLLLSSFPTYKDWFISNAFGDRDTYTTFSTNQYLLLPEAAHIHWLVVHSKGDTLVDLKQARVMYNHLRDCYRSAGLTQESESFVQSFLDSLTEEHDAVLKSPTFHATVAHFFTNIRSL